MIKEKVGNLLNKKVGNSEIDVSKILFFLGIAAISIYVYKKVKDSKNAAARTE